jgi:hypothetical protein
MMDMRVRSADGSIKWEVIAWLVIGTVNGWCIAFVNLPPSTPRPTKVAAQPAASDDDPFAKYFDGVKPVPPVYPDVYFQCVSDKLPMQVCEAFGQGQLPSAEYMRTNVHYDECIARGGSTTQCDAGVRVLCRDVQRDLTETVQERKKATDECVAARKADPTKGSLFDCIDPDRVDVLPAKAE